MGRFTAAFSCLGIRLGETLDGQDEALPGVLMSTPDFGNHSAVVILCEAEEVHPVDIALTDLQAFPVQAGTVRDMQMVGIRQENLHLLVKIHMRPVAVQLGM